MAFDFMARDSGAMSILQHFMWQGVGAVIW